MRLPVQVWSSFFWKSPFNSEHMRDLRRAQREWRGEHRVYLSREAKDVVRWRRLEKGLEFHECVIPSETINVFCITHVDGCGRVYPYIPMPKEWQGSISGCYVSWMGEPGNIYEVSSDKIPLEMPVIKNGTVTMVERMVRIVPAALSTSLKVGDDGTFEVAWRKPTNARMLALNEEMEIAQGPAHYQRRLINGREWLVAVSEKNPEILALSSEIGWDKEPFNYMFGYGGGAELMMHQASLKRCVTELQEGKAAKVNREVETWITQFISQGRTSIGHSWFAPMVTANPQEALFAVESQYNIAAGSIKELNESEKFRQVIDTAVDVAVADDWLGYFWWDFYQDLRERITIRCCKACGQVIRGGHSDRRFCNYSENPGCYRKRNATSQRKKRAVEP